MLRLNDYILRKFKIGCDILDELDTPKLEINPDNGREGPVRSNKQVLSEAHVRSLPNQDC